MSVSGAERNDAVKALRLADLKPYLSVTVLECTGKDLDKAFSILQAFLRKLSEKPGLAIAVHTTGELAIEDFRAEENKEADLLRAFGFDGFYGVTRERRHRAPWAAKDTPVVDVTNDLTAALRRGPLIAVSTENTRALLKWARDATSPYRPVPAGVMSSTFDGDGKTLWLRGVHRRRVTKPDSKTLNGLQLQHAIDAHDDSTFAMSAMKINLDPEEASAMLRGDLCVAPERSHLSFKAMSSFGMFLAATSEALVLLDKTLASEAPLRNPFPGLAVPENDLGSVFGAFDIRVTDLDEMRGEPDFDETQADRAELLHGAILDVHGDLSSPGLLLSVGLDGVVAGQLKVIPVGMRDGYMLNVSVEGSPTDEVITRRIRRAIGNGDLLNVYYESGHAFNGQRICRQNPSSTPFRNLTFVDFSGVDITREKPNADGDQAIHDATAETGDDSLFGWIVRNFGHDWLICDDGAGEVADFLHLADDGTLTAIHVKAAQNSSLNRRIAVVAYQEVVAQAVKNIRSLDTDSLIARLSLPSISRPACWHAGKRIGDRSEFIARLGMRTASDRTQVVIVQPHLRQQVHDDARAAALRGELDRNARSMMLLDNILHSTRRTVTGLHDDLIVIGSA
ncbi:hypothetical protein [Lentzea sp. NPDC092896]|uniref:hypothetical protein n=1 Tax=Lentzea sp. NPDC092896 TaxID=3364127 RepID=UPI0037F158B6